MLPWQHIILAVRQSLQICSLRCCALELPFVPPGLRLLNTKDQIPAEPGWWQLLRILYFKKNQKQKPQKKDSRPSLGSQRKDGASSKAWLLNWEQKSKFVLLCLVGCGWFYEELHLSLLCYQWLHRSTYLSSNPRFFNGITGICLTCCFSVFCILCLYLAYLEKKNVFSQLVYRLRSVLSSFVPLIEKFRPTGNWSYCLHT